MKQVVSVSLGSSQRDHRAQVQLWGELFQVERRGLDGKFKEAQALLRQLDGQVDAIGLGGVDITLRCRERRYTLRDGQRLLDCVQKTPVADGSGLKDTLEASTVQYLAKQENLQGKRVLIVSALDRFGLAQALVQAGASCIFGDKIFALNLDQPIFNLDSLEQEAEKLLPELCKLPISMLYPVGPSQAKIEPQELTTRYLQEAEWICGDFHLIRRRLPQQLTGKTVLTNTITQDDIQQLRQRGVRRLITTTPEFSGRSFGTNVLEAMLLAAGKTVDQLEQAMPWQPRIVEFI